MPDNSAALAEYSRRRHEATLARTTAALRLMQSHGGPVTYQAVASAAGVSRAWLYTQPAIRTTIDQLRSDRGPARSNVPSRQRASETSLRRRLEAAHLRNRHLDTEIRTLREQLAAAHGELRSLRAAGHALGEPGR